MSNISCLTPSVRGLNIGREKGEQWESGLGLCKCRCKWEFKLVGTPEQSPLLLNLEFSFSFQRFPQV